jgi:predicted Zn finger-like uncharacterized protein
MATDAKPAFICNVCARVLTETHVPPNAPQCPSCGAATKPNAAMRAKAGDVRCAHCGHTETAYQNRRCPKCDTVFNTFAPRSVKA